MSKAAELAALIGSQTALSNRNLIINGAMQVAQRGTSFTNPAHAVYTLDRWVVLHSSDAAVDVSQSTTHPTGFKNSLKLDVTTADSSLASSQYYILNTRLEGQNLSHLNYGSSNAKQVTISFWVRSNKTGTYFVEIQLMPGSQELARSYTINTADTWEHKTLTWIANTDFAITETNALGIHLYWWLAAGSIYTSSPLATTWAANTNRVTGQTNFLDSTSNEFYLTGVQLEIGDVATPFEHRSFGDELLKCQRYYRKVDTYSPTYLLTVRSSDDVRRLSHVFSKMRGDPTATILDSGGGTVTVQGTGKDSIQFTVSGHGTSDAPYVGSYTLDSEL